jgi:nitrogen fixation-related uncharacterized protein
LYGADTTWITIAAAIIMGLSGVCLFIFAVKSDHFRDFEDAKYQVFWGDIDALEPSTAESRLEQKGKNDSTPKAG